MAPVTFAQNLKDLRDPLFYRDVVIEMFLSVILAFFLGANQVQYGGYQTTPVQAGFTMGTCMFCIIEGFGHISGAHVNPSISFMFMLHRDISIVRWLFYTMAQCGGGAIGAFIIYGVNAPSHRDNFVTFSPAEGVTSFQAVVFEAMVTMLMCVTTLGVVDTKQRTTEVNMPGLPIGFSISIGIMIGRSYTGASLNPMIPLGPAIHTGIWKYYWIYWVGPYSGAAISVIVHVLSTLVYNKYSKRQSLDISTHFENVMLENIDANKGEITLRHRENGIKQSDNQST